MQIKKNQIGKENKFQLIDQINLPTEIAQDTTFYLFKDSKDVINVLVKGNVFNKQNIFVRIHSECLFGDILSSLRCDCGKQLEKAKQLMKKEENGILFYLGQEGRGIGIENKVKAYKLQEQGHDTVDANVLLGFKADLRNYDSPAKILKEFFKINSVQLATNNPKKIKELEAQGITVTQLPLIIKPNKHNENYLKTKKIRMGHKI